MMDRIVLALVAGSAVFGALLFSELNATVDEPVVVPSAPRAEAPAVPAPQRPMINQLVQTTLSQPLFSPTRRPPDTEVVSRESDTEVTNMRLTGIVLDPHLRLAIFAVPGSKPLARAEGENINEWHVDTIGVGQVSLSGAAGTMVLEPKSDPALVRPQQAAGGVPGKPPPLAVPGAKPPPFAVPPQTAQPVAAARPPGVQPRAAGQQPGAVLFPAARPPGPANIPAARPTVPRQPQ
jgi:hypothetical protein